MGIRQDVKSGRMSSKDALTILEIGGEVTPSIEGWLKRRINRNADAQEEAAREKAAEKAKAEENARPVKKRGKKRKPRK